jgi:hypothetical protein
MGLESIYQNNKNMHSISKLLSSVISAFLLGFFLSPGIIFVHAQKGSDQGYFFVGPEIETSGKKFKDGKYLMHYTHEGGVAISENVASPWHDGILYVQGSALMNEKGERMADVALCEITDKDGDLCWFVFRSTEEGFKLEIKAGTGKWDNISGSAKMGKVKDPRADGYHKFPWEMSWEILEQSITDNPINKDKYEFHDQGLSFHGPHVTTLSKELNNKVNLVYSNQSGVLLSEDPEAVSPRNFATCFDRGTTYQLEGKTLGDVMLLEDTDPDGDIVWLYHEWWYGKGPGSYEFIEGTGKWKSITGIGVTLGMLRARTDDHFMLRSEMHWNIK